MDFLVPAAFAGLLLIPVILVLHMLRNRRQQIPISSLALWRGLQKRRRGSRFRTIPLSLMLMLQLCAVIGLVLSLSQPVSSFILQDPWHTIYILDMSTSMLADDVPVTEGNLTAANRFEAARERIKADLSGASSQDSFAVIGLKPRPEILLTGRGDETISAVAELDRLQAGATGIDLPAAFTLATSLINPEQNNKIVVLTDGNYTLDPATLPALGVQTDWQFISSGSVSNQALVNVSTKTLPSKRHQLFARIINYSDSPVERTLRVLVGDREVERTTVDLTPGGEAAQVWALPARAESARIEIVEADALAADNVAHLWLQSTTRHRVLLRSTTTDTLKILARVLEAQPNVDLTIEQPDDEITHDPAQFDLTVLQGVTLTATESLAGNLLVINPAPQRSRPNTRPDPTTAAEWLSEIDWSGVYMGRVLADEPPAWAEIDLVAQPQQLLAIIGESEPQPAGQDVPALIFHGVTSNQRVIVWAFSLDNSNLPARLAFPLLMDSTLSRLLAPLPPATVFVGETVSIDGRSFSVALPDGRRVVDFNAAGGDTTRFVNTIQPGIYRIYQDDDIPVAGFAVHAGSALESNLTTQFQPDSRLTGGSRPLTNLATETEYYAMWPWLTSLVLVIVLVEGGFAWWRRS